MPASRATNSLSLVVSADCNFRCAYCYQDSKQPRQMSWPTMSRALDLLTSSNRRRADVTFLGGEPLLGYPLIVRAVRRVGRRFPAKRRPTDVQGLLRRRAHLPHAALAAGIFGPQSRKQPRSGACAACRHAAVCFICPIACARNPDSAAENRIPDFQCAFNRIALEYRRRFPIQH